METIKFNVYDLVISVPRWDSLHELPSMDSREAETFFTDPLFKGQVLQQTQGFTDYRFILEDYSLVCFFKNAPWPKFWEKFITPGSDKAEAFAKCMTEKNAIGMAKILSEVVDEPWTLDLWKLQKIKAYEAVVEIPEK